MFIIYRIKLRSSIIIRMDTRNNSKIWALIIVILFSGVFNATPIGIMSAEFFVFITVLLGAFTVGFLLHGFFIGRK